MKNWRIMLPILALMLLLGGCNLQNRRPSSDFVPATEATEATRPPETEPTEPTREAVTETASPEVAVRETVNLSGSYMDRYGKKYEYSFHVPYIDSESGYAQGCNREIDTTFGRPVEAARKAMEEQSPLEIRSVDYTTRLRSGMLTVYVTMYDTENEKIRAVYTLDQKTGEAVESARMIAWAELSEEEFLSDAEAAIGAAHMALYNPDGTADPVKYEAARGKTLAEGVVSAQMPLYIDEDDRLVLLVEMYDLAMGRHIEPVRLGA